MTENLYRGKDLNNSVWTQTIPDIETQFMDLYIQKAPVILSNSKIECTFTEYFPFSPF